MIENKETPTKIVLKIAIFFLIDQTVLNLQFKRNIGITQTECVVPMFQKKFIFEMKDIPYTYIIL